MHAGLRSDRGGNDYQISYLGEAWNLHSVWDSLILRQPLQHDGGWHGISRRLSNTALLLSPNELPPHSGPREWALESCRLVGHQQLYPRGRKIGNRYHKNHRPPSETHLQPANRKTPGRGKNGK